MTPKRTAGPRGHRHGFHEFQRRVLMWSTRCFGAPQACNPTLNSLRVLEEAIEFAQSVGVQQDVAEKLLRYVYERPAGDPVQELGGVAIAFLAAASALNVTASYVTGLELDRIEAKNPEHFTARNQAKCEAGFR